MSDIDYREPLLSRTQYRAAIGAVTRLDEMGSAFRTVSPDTGREHGPEIHGQSPRPRCDCGWCVGYRVAGTTRTV